MTREEHFDPGWPKYMVNLGETTPTDDDQAWLKGLSLEPST